MNYQVLARKWRPRTFDELVGQRHVTRALTNALESGRLAHAYIFAGLRGTGKTTVARIFATCLNVEDGPTATPDPESPIAKEIAEGRAIDVLELDAASRTSVDNIRELQEVIAYPPVRDRYKVLIIDEAHMLSKAAFNALLKTLEEPPPGVMFILATTELQKILPTILSRCQTFEFRRVATAEVSAHLRKLADAEGIEISDHSLERIARAGEGSVRDALSVLERVLAFCGMQASDEDVMRVLGVVDREVLQRFVGALAARDAAALLGELDRLVDDGHDLFHFWSELIGVLRDLIRDRVSESAPGARRPPSELAELRDVTGDLSRHDLTRAFELLAALEPALRSSSQPRYLFESAVIRLADLGAVRPIEELLAGGGLAGGGSAPAGPARSGGARTAPGRPSGAAPSGAAPSGAGMREARPPAPAGAPAMAGPAAPPPAPPAAAPQVASAINGSARLAADASGPELVRALIGEIGTSHPFLATMLEGARPQRDDGRLVLAFAAGQKMLARQLDRPEQLDTLRDALGRLTDAAWQVAIAVDDAAPTNGATTASPKNERAALLEAAKTEPGVRRLLLEFGGQLLDVQPLAPDDADLSQGDFESPEDDA